MTTDDIMKTAHLAARDDAARGIPYAHGAADALLASGQMDEEKHRLWGLALKTCPGHADGPRAWCAYCGDVYESAAHNSGVKS